jgi:phytoene dehydrogenase-like protein
MALNEKIYKGQSFLYIENPNGYGIFLSNLDPSIAPEGKQLFSAFIPLSPLKINDQSYIKEYMDKAREYIYNMFPK